MSSPQSKKIPRRHDSYGEHFSTHNNLDDAVKSDFIHATTDSTPRGKNYLHSQYHSTPTYPSQDIVEGAFLHNNDMRFPRNDNQEVYDKRQQYFIKKTTKATQNYQNNNDNFLTCNNIADIPSFAPPNPKPLPQMESMMKEPKSCQEMNRCVTEEDEMELQDFDGIDVDPETYAHINSYIDSLNPIFHKDNETMAKDISETADKNCEIIHPLSLENIECLMNTITESERALSYPHSSKQYDLPLQSAIESNNLVIEHTSISDADSCTFDSNSSIISATHTKISEYIDSLQKFPLPLSPDRNKVMKEKCMIETLNKSVKLEAVRDEREKKSEILRRKPIEKKSNNSLQKVSLPLSPYRVNERRKQSEIGTINKALKLEAVPYEKEMKPIAMRRKAAKEKINDNIESLQKIPPPLSPTRFEVTKRELEAAAYEKEKKPKIPRQRSIKEIANDYFNSLQQVSLPLSPDKMKVTKKEFDIRIVNKAVKLEVITHNKKKNPINMRRETVKGKLNDNIDPLRKVSLPLLPDRVKVKNEELETVVHAKEVDPKTLRRKVVKEIANDHINSLQKNPLPLPLDKMKVMKKESENEIANKVAKLEAVTHEKEKKLNNMQGKVIKKKTNGKIDSLQKVPSSSLSDSAKVMKKECEIKVLHKSVKLEAVVHEKEEAPRTLRRKAVTKKVKKVLPDYDKLEADEILRENAWLKLKKEIKNRKRHILKKVNPSVPRVYINTRPSYISCDISSSVNTNSKSSAEEQCLIKNDTLPPDRISHGKIKESNSNSFSSTPILDDYNNEIANETVMPTKRIASIGLENSVGKESVKIRDNHHNNISEKMLPFKSSERKWQAIMDNLVQTLHVTDESTNLVIATNAVKAEICNPDKHQNDCSINSDLQISNILEAHIESSNDCIDEVFEDTDGNKFDDKMDVPRNMLSILNLSEERGDDETIENEEDMAQEQAYTSTSSIYPLLEQNNQDLLKKELRNESENISLQDNVKETCENGNHQSMNYIHENLCVGAIDLTETQSENNFLSQQINCDHDKHQNDCSINSDLKISNILEAHIESSDDCIDEVFVGTDGNKFDDKMDVPRNMLSILNLSEERGDDETIENEEDMVQEQAAVDTRLSHPNCSSTSSIYPLLEQNNQDLLEKELRNESENISLQDNVTKGYNATNYDAIDTQSFQGSCSTVYDAVFSPEKVLSKRDNEDFEEVIDDILIDSISLLDRMVLPIVKVINEVDKDVSNENDCCSITNTGSKSVSSDDSTRNILVADLDVDVKVKGGIKKTISGTVSYSSQDCGSLEFDEDLDEANRIKIFMETSLNHNNANNNIRKVQSSHLAKADDHSVLHSYLDLNEKQTKNALIEGARKEKLDVRVLECVKEAQIEQYLERKTKGKNPTIGATKMGEYKLQMNHTDLLASLPSIKIYALYTHYISFIYVHLYKI